MDLFIKVHSLSKKDANLVSCTSKQCGEYTLHTYKPNVKKNQYEDQLFIDNPLLVSILPRACTWVVHTVAKLSEKLNEYFETGLDPQLFKLEGCCKFTGLTDIDEDPDDENKLVGSKNDNLFDYNLIKSCDNLEIVMTEKANGKFAIFKI